MAEGVRAKSINFSEVLGNGFLIRIVVNQFGYYLAYVSIPKDYEHIDDVEDNLNLYGGITYGPSDQKVNGMDYVTYGCDFMHYGDGSDTIEYLEHFDRLGIKQPPVIRIWNLQSVKEEIMNNINDFLNQYLQNENPEEDDDDE